MQAEPEYYLNRNDNGRYSPNRTAFGRQLEAGDVLEPDDLYESTSGSWERCPCPGLTLSGPITIASAPIWVRPGK